MAKIRFEHVRKEFLVRGKDGGPAQSFTALDDITLDVRAGEFLALVGPSGCGKSTLLDLLGGLTAPSSGRILLDGKVIEGPARDRGIVFQQYALFPWRTAAQNVEFGLDIAGLKARERRERALHYLDFVKPDLNSISWCRCSACAVVFSGIVWIGRSQSLEIWRSTSTMRWHRPMSWSSPTTMTSWGV